MNLDLRTLLFVNNKHLIYIQSWPNILAPLVNMIKEGCELLFFFLLLILLILFKKKYIYNLSVDNKNLKWKSQWGSDMWFSFGVSNRTAGVAILKDKFSGQVISHKTDDQGRWIIILVEINQVKVIIINIYATNNKKMNGLIFQDIERNINSLHSKFPSAEVIWGGDFNTVFDGIQDRCPPKVDSSINELSNVLFKVKYI